LLTCALAPWISAIVTISPVIDIHGNGVALVVLVLVVVVKEIVRENIKKWYKFAMTTYLERSDTIYKKYNKKTTIHTQIIASIL